MRMARPWRIEYEGALYHVFSRDNNQQDIFVTDDDRNLSLDTIGQVTERFDNDIFAYVLMDNSDFIELLTQESIFSEKTTLTHLDVKDEDDIVIISTALNGNAEIFVTGDKELLALGIVQSMQIISPRMFWEMLKTQPPDEL